MRPTRALPNPYLGPSALKRRPLLIKARRNDERLYIALSGELELASVDELDSLIREAEETDVARIYVDLSGVSFIDSNGLSVLLRAKRRNDGRLRYIPSSHDQVTRMLQLSGTLEMFG